LSISLPISDMASLHHPLRWINAPADKASNEIVAPASKVDEA
jgi:hypothetical protein